MNNNNKKDQLVHVSALSSQPTFGDLVSSNVWSEYLIKHLDRPCLIGFHRNLIFSSNDKIVKLKVILCILTAVSLCDVLLSFTLLLRSSFRINSPNTDLDRF